MMGQICIHYEDEVPSSMLHAVDVGSAFDGKQEELIRRLEEHINDWFYSFKLTQA